MLQTETSGRACKRRVIRTTAMFTGIMGGVVLLVELLVFFTTGYDLSPAVEILKTIFYLISGVLIVFLITIRECRKHHDDRLLNGADRTVLFNYVTQKTAAEFGFRATFMPKPFDGYNRNALHLHLSMQNQEGVNVFYDQDAPQNIGTTARQFIGGILKYARETSIIMASTFNSYKAYVIEREAPIICNWGFRNRSSMVRIPYCSKPQATRLELRSPDPAGNVYFQVTTLIAMGLEGIRKNITCGEQSTVGISAKDLSSKILDKRFLPKSMFEALAEAEKSTFLVETLGEETYQNFMKLKTREWEKHRTTITSQELSMYLDR